MSVTASKLNGGGGTKVVEEPELRKDREKDGQESQSKRWYFFQEFSNQNISQSEFYKKKWCKQTLGFLLDDKKNKHFKFSVRKQKI